MIKIKKELFDNWSERYDANVIKNDFPFVGYEQIKDEILQSCEINHSTQILDVGVGTGNFLNEFYIRNGQCYGIDFSDKMLAIATEKMRSAYLVQHDLNDGVPKEFLKAKFSIIIAAYVLHHFKFEKKVALIREYLDLLKKEDGRLYIVDVSFRTRKEHDNYREKNIELWDETEYYFIAEEMISIFNDVEYKQFSECGGVYLWDITR